MKALIISNKNHLYFDADNIEISIRKDTDLSYLIKIEIRNKNKIISTMYFDEKSIPELIHADKKIFKIIEKNNEKIVSKQEFRNFIKSVYKDQQVNIQIQEYSVE